MFYFDNLGLHIPVIAGSLYYASYIALTMTHKMLSEYVVKLQYSKDKELLYVTRINRVCALEEEAFEVQHLEILPPSVKAGVSDMSSQDYDGLYDIVCMNSHKTIVVYNEEKYWNPSLRKEFFDKVMNYWTPDLIPQSRTEQILNYLTTPKIEIGFETPKLESN